MKDSFVVFDLETTGLAPNCDRILEIGALKVKDGEVVDKFQTFINPRMEIPQRIVELTGITNDMVKGAPTIQEVIEAFVKFTEGFPLLGHNVIFDYSFIKFNANNASIPFERKGLDTLIIARKLLPQLESRRLTYLCEFFHIPLDQAHRAFEDAKATYELYKRLKEDYYKEEKELFSCRQLHYHVKKQGPITKFQKVYLNDLIKYHKIDFNVEVDSLTKSQASRAIDKMILQYGRIKR